jgi:hypothetical protein
VNSTLKKIRQKANSNNKKKPFISIDDVLLIRAELDTEDKLLIGDILSWLKERSIEVKEFDNLNVYLKGEVDKLGSGYSRDATLDKITPTCLHIMNNLLSGEEQSVIHYLAIGDLTKNKLSNYLTTKFLSKKLRIESKKLSVYLSKLVNKGLVKRRAINNKNFEYKINSKIFIDWYEFRYKKRGSK